MSKQKKQKLQAKDWLPYFEKAGIRVDELAECKSERSKAIKVGQFLSPMVGRAVSVQVDGRTGKAVLYAEQDRAKTKLYFVEVTWDNSAPKDAQTENKSDKTMTGEKKPKTSAKKVPSQQNAAAPGGKKSKAPPKMQGKKQGHSQSDAASPDRKTGKVQAKVGAGKPAGNNENWG